MASSKTPRSGMSVCDGKDEEFSEGFYRICCLNNRGRVKGHFLRIDGDMVTADANSQDEKTLLKIRAVQNDNDELIMIIENVQNEAMFIERDDANEKYKIAVKTNEELENIHTLRDAERQTNNFLFKKIPREAGSEIFQITSNASAAENQALTLAFDDNGKPMDPTENHHEDGSFFRLLSA